MLSLFLIILGHMAYGVTNGLWKGPRDRVGTLPLILMRSFGCCVIFFYFSSVIYLFSGTSSERVFQPRYFVHCTNLYGQLFWVIFLFKIPKTHLCFQCYRLWKNGTDYRYSYRCLFLWRKHRYDKSISLRSDFTGCYAHREKHKNRKNAYF